MRGSYEAAPPEEIGLDLAVANDDDDCSNKAPLKNDRLAIVFFISLAMHLLAIFCLISFGRLSFEAGESSPRNFMTVNLAAGREAFESGEAEAGGAATEEFPLEKSLEFPAAESQPAAEPPEPAPPLATEAESIDKTPEPAAIKEKIKTSAPQKTLKKTDRVSRPKSSSRGYEEGQGSDGEAAGPGRSAAPGATGAAQGAADGYLKANYEYIKKRIRKNLVYNPQAKRMGLTGTATISFVIGRNGQANNIEVAVSSGYESLDESALAAVRRASPFSPPPAPARIVIPIIFSLK
jgi:protein TonB